MYIKNKNLVAKTPFLDLVEVVYEIPGGKRGTWFGVSRNNAPFAVIVAAVTEKEELIFVRQPRPLVGSYTIELPAGLADIPGESATDVAKRETLEETGYLLYNSQVLIGGDRGLTISSGLSDERVILVAGRVSEKVAEPLANEATEPILVPLQEAEQWLFKMSETHEVDFKDFGIVKIVRDWLGGQ